MVPDDEATQVVKTELDSLLEFLEGEVEAEERVDIASQSFLKNANDAVLKRPFMNTKQQNKHKSKIW